MATGIDGSYRIFKHVVNIYEKLFYVDIACRHKELFYTMRNKLILQEGLCQDLDRVELVESFFLLWYGIFWNQPEDIGYAIGVYIRQFFSMTLEDFSKSDPTWVCPPKKFFDSRETYNSSIIGKW